MYLEQGRIKGEFVSLGVMVLLALLAFLWWRWRNRGGSGAADHPADQPAGRYSEIKALRATRRGKLLDFLIWMVIMSILGLVKLFTS